MKIIQIAKAGKMLDQPHGKNPSGKLDSQIFLGKDDPSHVDKNKKKKKKEKKETSTDSSCSVCEAKRNN
jgi:hypothetical protein